jgi:hypothetical protein
MLSLPGCHLFKGELGRASHSPRAACSYTCKEQGFREVLAVEAASEERKEAYRNLLKG